MTEYANNPAYQAAKILLERRINGIAGDRLPESCRPTTLDEALAIQDAVAELWCESRDDSIGAWKCGLPSADKVVIATIFTRTIDSVPPITLLPKGKLARIEPEFAFFFGTDLPPRSKAYTPEEVDAAISRTHLALELIGCRYAEPSTCEFPEMLADGLVNQGLFIGPQIDSDLARAASEFTITVTAGDETICHAGKHPSGNPRAPLYWLAEFLRSRGQGIMAGQAVITGSFAGVIEVPLDTGITIKYAGFRDMNVCFAATKKQH